MEIFEPLWPFEGHAKASCLDLIPDFDSNTTKSSFSYCWTIQRWTWWCVSDRNSSALERQRMNWCLIFSTRMCWKVPSVSYPGHLQATWVLPAVVDSSIYGSAVWGTFLWSYREAVSAFFLPLLGLFNFSQLPVSVDRTSHAVLVTDDSDQIHLSDVFADALWLWLSPFLLFLCSWFTEPEGAGPPTTVRRVHVLKSVAALITSSWPLFSCLGGFYLWLTFMNPYHDSHWPLRFPATYSSCICPVLPF